jgi:hypothetical protein
MSHASRAEKTQTSVATQRKDESVGHPGSVLYAQSNIYSLYPSAVRDDFKVFVSQNHPS